MKYVNQSNFCENCRKDDGETFTVKFPAVDNNQYQEFCKPCAEKFQAWKKREITIENLFDVNFKLKGE